MNPHSPRSGRNGRSIGIVMTGLVIAFALHSWIPAYAFEPSTLAPWQDAGKQGSGLLDLPDTLPARGMSWPALSPDGRTLCFVYLGDLWTVPATGGAATRLTEHETLDTYPHWSPDGKFIAFTSMRTGNADIFLVPAQGGAARQVTFNPTPDWVTDWSPDGTKLLFYSTRDTKALSLFSIDLRTRAIKKLSRDEAPLRYGAWSPDGKTIAYTRAGQPWWRAWYRGSQASQTIIEDLGTGKVRTLLKTTTQQIWPAYAPDGKSIYVSTIYGNSNTPNLYRVPFGEKEGGTPIAITKYTTDAVRYPTVARKAGTIAYIYNGDLYTAKADGSGATKLSIICHSDDKTNNTDRTLLTSGAKEVELSPDGKQLALVLQNNIWLIPVAGGDAKPLTDDISTNDDIIWSPDNTKLVFVSDRNNQPDLYTLDVKTKAVARLTTDGQAKLSPQYSPDGKWISYARAGSPSGLYLVPADGSGQPKLLVAGNGNNYFGQGIGNYAWSPDSKWVAFTRMDRYLTRDIWIIPAAGGSAINVTRNPDLNNDPKFTKDGRNLLFFSDRDGGGLFRIPLEKLDEAPVDPAAPKKKPEDRSKDVKIDFDEIHERAKKLVGGQILAYAPQPDSQRVVVSTPGGFVSVGIEGGSAPLSVGGETGSNIAFLPDGSRFYYLGSGSPRSLGNQPGQAQQPSIVGFSAEILTDKRAVMRQAFNEFYRKFGTFFYDAKMHGVDWPSLRAKYEPYLAGVGTPEEFANVLSEMVGEVNASHSEITPAARPGGPQPASLGIFFDDSYSGPGIKVASVMPNGPADYPSNRIKSGEYLLSVNGTDVSFNEEYYKTLYDKAGKVLELVVNGKPVKEGARTVRVKAISSAEWADLDYQARVKRRRALVDKLSNGRLAYAHIRAMNGPSLQKFEHDLYSDAFFKEGLVLDIRGNGGGNTHDRILEALSRRVYGYMHPRDGQRQTQPYRAWTRPVILLIDQESFSDAEAFPEGFRALKLGKIVGITTPGYLIFTREDRLIDGTGFRLPSTGYYTVTGRNMENLGVTPDVVVENTPEDAAEGRDRQLETAVQLILQEVASNPDKTAGPDTPPSSANLNPNGGSSAVRPGQK